MDAQNQTPHQTWNVGRIIRPKPLLKPKHIWAKRTRLQHKGRIRDPAMLNLAVDSKLRDVTSFASVSAMSSLEAPFGSERLLFNRRLGGPYHSN